MTSGDFTPIGTGTLWGTRGSRNSLGGYEGHMVMHPSEVLQAFYRLQDIIQDPSCPSSRSPLCGHGALLEG